MFIPEKQHLRTALYTLIVLVPASIGITIYSSLWWKKPTSIKVGILYATTGPSASIEQPIVDSILLAIEEINTKGGVLGNLLEPIIADTMSQEALYKEEAERLISKEHVAVIFGCLDSISRKAVKEIVENHNNMLVYPGIYEGLEYSANIMYAGMIPNQFVLPGILWCFNNIGKKFYLAGTASLFSVVINNLAKTYIQHLGGTIVGESTIPINDQHLEALITDINEKQPDVIVNTLEPGSNLVYFKSLYELIHPATNEEVSHKFPTIAFNLYEDELDKIGVNFLTGHYMAWNYYSGLNSERNREFKYNLSKKFGSRKITGDLFESAYTSVYLWTKAVNVAHSTEPASIVKILSDISFNAPGGLVYFDSTTNHVWRTSKVGQITIDGKYNVVWNSKKALEPIIYPLYSKEYWTTFLQKYL